MKIKFQYKIAIIAAFAGLQGAYAQKKDENIGTEVVNVVKPYTPTISDAFKVKETPVIEDEKEIQKEEIKYNIFSFPVASTFAPAKGKAAAVDKEKREKLFNNYATLGLGNYGTVNAELFVTEALSSTEYVGAMLRHISSQGGIKDVVLDDKYTNTAIDLTYGNRQQKFTWNTDLGYQNQAYNWYGLPIDYTSFSQEIVNSIDPKQTYNTAYIGGKISTKESFFHDAQIQYKRFWDGYGSAENRFFLTPSFDVDVADEKIKVDFVADYVGGTMGDDTPSPVEYSNFNVGVQPSLLYQKDDLSVQLGAGLFYTMSKLQGESDNKLNIYPQVKASYKVVGDLMVAYAGAEGAMKQNSYADFVSQNPFVAPNLVITPTSQQYDVYVGLKGKLASAVSYNVRGSYMKEDNRALFASYIPGTDGVGVTPLDNYQYGNSFNLVYDDLKTVSFFAELKADFSKTVAFGINGTFNSYTTDRQAEAWNLPTIKVGANLDVNITEKWYAGLNVFFVGERKDTQFADSVLEYPAPGTTLPLTQTVSLDSYFDVNAHVGYKYSERLTGFLRLNNIANQNYQKWVNYQVQGFQFVLGASYKFNF